MLKLMRARANSIHAKSLPTVVAPANAAPLVMVDDMSMQLKALVAGSKTPTQLAAYGANMAIPLTFVAPVNAPEVMVEETSMQLKAGMLIIDQRDE